MSSELPEEELRRRYLDWCSSRVARRFLELSHDEVWLRSHAVAAADPSDFTESDEEGGAAVDRIPGYLDLVRRTALLLAQEMNLPAFEEWKASYQEDPERFRREMLGR